MVQYPNYGRVTLSARACRNSLLWYNLLDISQHTRAARACRNSLLWYNENTALAAIKRLGLVGIPCYGTITSRYDTTTGELGLVGIPCYGTMNHATVDFWTQLGLVGIPCYGTMVDTSRPH